MQEIWKDIKGYEGLYKVSNMGRVKRVSRDRILKNNNDIYSKVILSKNGYIKSKYVHRLVAETFIANPENKPQVNHIDEDKTNNAVSNLEWPTNSENINYGMRNEKAGKANSIPIYAINIKTSDSQEFYGAAECAKSLGLNASHITSVLKGRRKQTGGYTFKYIKEGVD